MWPGKGGGVVKEDAVSCLRFTLLDQKRHAKAEISTPQGF